MPAEMKVDEDMAKVIYQVSIKEHSKKKTMWGGSFAPSDHTMWLLGEGGRFEKDTVKFADSLYKNFDEVLANSIDQYIKMRSKTKKYRVSMIAIDFSPDGYISIFNNGDGIPVCVVRDLEGKPVYSPQLISTEFLAGTNNVDDNGRITGGVNGVGMSMVNNNSKHFVLTTVDIGRKKHYVQECRDRLGVVGAPVVTSLGSVNPTDPHKHGGTTVRFLPEYSIYKCDLVNEYKTLKKVFKSRAAQAAAHIGVAVTFNGEELGVKDMKTFAKLFMDEDMFAYAKVKHEKYDWDVVVGVNGTGCYESLSIINGISIPTGNHLNYVRDQVIDGVKARVEKLLGKFVTYRKAMVQNEMFVMISGNIENPEFDSQTKTNISGSVAKYKGYRVSAGFLTKVWKIMEPRLVERYITKEEKKNEKKKTTKGIKKYTAAKHAGGKKAAQCRLIICEGDSAESMTRTCLDSKEVSMGYDYYGTFNIQGVPLNSRKKTKVYAGGRKIREKQLVANERLSSLETVLNLKHDMVYDTQKERDSLRYGGVDISVDQDLDGLGQIKGLLISHFELFWPALIKHGYLRYLATPIIRAFPKKGVSVLSFYSDGEYRKWADASNTDEWDIKYYKGLATHNDAEAIDIYKKYDRSIYTITLDDRASDTLVTYYGNDPDLRKKELVGVYEIKEPAGMEISCTDQLRTHTKEFQVDNIKRKLPHIVDGLNPSRRKTLCGSRKRFAVSNAEVKVFQLAGNIAEKMNYHHGSASLEKTIINMAQTYVGANNLPLLLPMSQFGKRHKGGKDAGAPRYIKTKLNKDLSRAMFRVEDDYVIEYEWDEGVRNEPVHYVPVAPMALLESLELPATGWKYEGYAREWKSVYSNVKSLIKAKIKGGVPVVDVKDVRPMPFWKNRWTGETRRTVRPKCAEWSVGKYQYTNNTIEVTELPFGCWTDKWKEDIAEKSLVVGVDELKGVNSEIGLLIKLKPNGLEEIEKLCGGKGYSEFDVIEDYLLLKSCMNTQLNFIKDGIVYESDSYEDVLVQWFSKRYETYVKRFDRLREWTRLKIIHLKECELFVGKCRYKFGELDEATAVKMLEADGYKKMNHGLLSNPGFTPVGLMEELTISCPPFTDKGSAGKHSYGYLFNIGPRQRMRAARVNRRQSIVDLEKYLEKISGSDIIRDTWLEELDDLNAVIVKGTTHVRGWMYGEKAVRFA
jgi:DNA gyrase/topoisomerase IV subunit B